MPESPQSIALCPAHALERGAAVTQWVPELSDELTALVVDGELRVYSTLCPHAAGELRCDRRREEFECRWHRARFSLTSGAALAPRTLPALRRYEARLIDGRVVVQLAPDPVGESPR